MKTLLCMLIALVMLSCQRKTNSEKAMEKLYIVTTTSVGDMQHATDSITEVTADTFEIDLAFMTDSGELYTDKVVERSKDGENFRLVNYSISNKEGERVRFDSKDQFLKYLADRGYAALSSKNESMRTAFVFKK